jgi:ubiquinone/menaquinone biosynthesis C-methylase UbiE
MKFLDPNHVLKQFGVYGTQHVADFGSGAGHFALAAARRLDGGKLFAIDIEKEMLARLVSEAHTHGLHNVHPLWGDVSRLTGVPLAGETIDRAIATNVLFQVDDRDAFVQEMKRLLRPGGKVLLIEWKESVQGGPHHKHKVTEAAALAIFRKHGFEKEKDIDAGDVHYGMILVRV